MNSTRQRTKQPIYTSDKRAKFTQRESKKWIRFATVVGYIFFVSLPALALSIYYIYIWDPKYIEMNPILDEANYSEYTLSSVKNAFTNTTKHIIEGDQVAKKSSAPSSVSSQQLNQTSDNPRLSNSGKES